MNKIHCQWDSNYTDNRAKWSRYGEMQANISWTGKREGTRSPENIEACSAYAAKKVHFECGREQREWDDVPTSKLANGGRGGDTRVVSEPKEGLEALLTCPAPDQARRMYVGAKANGYEGKQSELMTVRG